jgi:transposase InsO family protein
VARRPGRQHLHRVRLALAERLGESLHNRLRDECLNCEEFWSFAHARVALETWRVEYNTKHLHSSLGYATSSEFAAKHSTAAVLNAA